MTEATSSPVNYHAFARLLHWLMAAIIITAIVLVVFRDNFEDLYGWRTMGLHKSLGFTVLGLTVLRIIWRFTNPPPGHDGELSPGTERLAHIVHFFLYTAMLGLPILGYIISSAGPYPLDFFGMNVPKVPIEKGAMTEAAGTLHVWGGYLFTALIVGHFVAALYHHMALKDKTLLRMLGRADR